MPERRYNTVAIALHWAIAVLIVGQIAGGFYMHNLPNSAPEKFDLYQIHKSFGLSIFALTLVRLGWRLSHKPPALPIAMPGWQKFAARGTHWLFYILMLATPLVGLAIVSVSPKDIPTEWFGLVGVPHLGFLDPGADPAATEHQFIELHEMLSYAILGLLALHVAAALKHGFIDRDGVFRSMAPRIGALVVIIVLFVALGLGVTAYFGGKPAPVEALAATPPPEPAGATDVAARPEAPVEAEPVDPIAPTSPEPAPNASEDANAIANATPATPKLTTNSPCGSEMALAVNWRVDDAESRLRFIGAQGGQRFEGTFGDFDAEIAFDENHLDPSWLRVAVQTASAATGDQLIDSTLPGGDWFGVKEFPTATFTACDIQRTGDGAYEAIGSLTIKEVSRDIALPFELTVGEGAAIAAGGVDLIRTDFDLGAASSWLDEEGVALEARVEFSVSAEPID